MNSFFQHIEIGSPIPINNPHAVSVSLPTINDVIGYEENKPEILNKMKSGYPRFFMNKIVEQLCNFIVNKHNISNNFEVIPLMSKISLEIIERKFNSKFEYILYNEAIFLQIEIENTELKAVKDFIRHSGLLLSSRQAEDILFKEKIISGKFPEQIYENTNAEIDIKTNLRIAYNAQSNEDIFLTSSGMNSFYAVFEAIKELNKAGQKQTILQAGWLYVDSLEIIKKFNKNNILYTKTTDIDIIEQKIILEHKTISVVFTEVPNNPLVQCFDIERIYKLCKKYNIIFVVDSTIGTAHNMNILKYCDVVVESLTKFACGKADVLMGAIIFNSESDYAAKLKNLLLPNIVKPYFVDIYKMAKDIEGYKNRVEKVSENTKKVIEYLQKSKSVVKLFSVLNPENYENFKKIRKNEDSLPGLISVVFDKELAFYYDKLNFPKGPSLGTEFTLAMPYTYLAHYDLVKTENGKKELQKLGLDSELLRISIGIEPVEEIIKEFEKAGI